MAINVTDLNNRCVTTSTVGYMALALTGWMLSMTAAGWYDRFYLAGTSLMLPFALLLAIIGILAYLHGRSLDSIAFFAFAVLYTAAHASLTSMAGIVRGPDELHRLVLDRLDGGLRLPVAGLLQSGVAAATLPARHHAHLPRQGDPRLDGPAAAGARSAVTSDSSAPSSPRSSPLRMSSSSDARLTAPMTIASIRRPGTRTQPEARGRHRGPRHHGCAGRGPLPASRRRDRVNWAGLIARSEDPMKPSPLRRCLSHSAPCSLPCRPSPRRVPAVASLSAAAVLLPRRALRRPCHPCSLRWSRPAN